MDVQEPKQFGTQTPAEGFKSGREGKEPLKLLLRFVVIVATAPVIGWMMGRAWVPGRALYASSRDLLTGALGLPFSTSLQLLASFGLGFYVGLLVLFTFDMKKRVQGLLLVVGSTLAVGVLTYMGVLLPNIDLAPLNLLGAGVGLVLGVALEYGQLTKIDWGSSTLQRPTLQSGKVPEFRLTALLLFGLLTVAILLTVVQVVMAGVFHPLDFLASGVFLVVLFGFIRYSSESSYMVLGPARSGKSMMMLGLCLRLMKDSEVYPDPNDHLQNNLERASNLQPGRERWPIPSTPRDQINVVSFEVISGYYFPRRLELSALDYAGQHLGKIAELIESGRVDPEKNTISHRVAHEIQEADTLLVILDLERLYYPEKFDDTGEGDPDSLSWGLEYYVRILNNTDPDDVVVVATKADIMIANNDVPPPGEFESYDEFQGRVSESLTVRPDITQLMAQIDDSQIYPVYFVTKLRDGQFVPRLDDQGNLVPVGYGPLLTELRRRQ